jgi:hypothetical protein
MLAFECIGRVKVSHKKKPSGHVTKRLDVVFTFVSNHAAYFILEYSFAASRRASLGSGGFIKASTNLP